MNAASRPPRALVDFLSEDGQPPLRLAFDHCREIVRADTLAQVRPALQAAERHAAAGAWCVGFLRYEAAPAFDPAFAAHAADGPLLWFGVFDSAAPWPDAPATPGWHTDGWRSALAREAFDARIERIHEAIRAGETYQINLTEPLHSGFQGDAEAWFRALQREQARGYAAFIDTGEEQVLSVSPELFFDWDGERIRSRPMKGTAPRGADAACDAARAATLRASEKERAENLMIVDLIRNDLSRIARPHSVKVENLFQARAWPTVWQMTSDVVARTREGVGLADVFGALFPCGSVTGVPKVRATELIRSLETQPRGVYCGAAGLLRPGGGAIFNVPIRTVQLRQGRAVCGIGSGITIDALPEGEWDEWRNKRRFLDAARESFELIETLRLEAGVFVHRDAHLARIENSARHFGFGWDAMRVQQTLDTLAAAHAEGDWRIRLLLDANGQPGAEAFAFTPTATPVRVALASRPMEAVHPDFLRHKTTRRAHYSRFEPTQPGIFDTLLYNEAGEVTEFTRGNVVAQTQDGDWITPPLSAGLLPGVGRGLLLAEGRIREAVLRREDLPTMRALAFVNSLRGWLPASLAG